MIGSAAACGSLDRVALVLFLIVFLWQVLISWRSPGSIEISMPALASLCFRSSIREACRRASR